MKRWTNGAQECWQRFCDDVKRRLDPGDVDAEEVLDDLRRHVDTELNAMDLQVVTADDLRKILNSLQPPAAAVMSSEQSPGETAAPEPPKGPPAYQSVLTAFGGFYIIVFGVLLPVGAVAFELMTRICTSIFFDPLPTVWHIILFGLIPVANLVGYVEVKFNTQNKLRPLGFFNAVAIGIAVFYTLWFLPVLPFSAIGIIAMGIGLAGLAPLLSLIAALMVRRRLRLMARAYDVHKVPFLWPGLCSSMGLLLLLIVPAVLTLVGLNMAASPQPQTQARGLRLLRTFGDKEYLLNRCYSSVGFHTLAAEITRTDQITPEQMRGIYYRVTGRAFNTQRPDIHFLHRGSGWLDEWDFEQAGDVVGGQLRNLSLVSSQMDANLQADAGVGYCEWIMVFQNDHPWTQREARCQIQLPPGGVVSRLTLWIDGRECEAAFGGRAQTKGAYKSVVQRRRDPVLVTTKGPDQVLLQCFPVPPESGKMQVRVGITFPLDLLSKEQALLQLPYINEHNFQIPAATEHQVWIEADSRLSAALDLKAETHDGRYTLRGPVTNAQLERQQASIRAERNPQVAAVWAQKQFDDETVTVLQELQNNKGNALIDKAVVVLDTSRAMASHIPYIRSVLETLRADFELEIITADDLPQMLDGADKAGLDRVNFKGGKDNLPALVRAWDSASEAASAAVIWIHAAQPHIFEPVQPLTQRWMRRPDGPELIHVQIAPGPNRIIEELDGIGQVRAVARSANLEDDLARLFGQLNGTLPRYRFVRKPVDTPEPNAKKASSHIVRLWARDEVEALRTRRGSTHETKAKALAVRHQLVTPVSGAVVLENQAQYDQHGLQPVDGDTVPTIPEPATLLLFGTGALLLSRYRRRKGPGRKPALRP